MAIKSTATSLKAKKAGSLKKPSPKQQLILNATAYLARKMGVPDVPRSKVAALTGFKTKNAFAVQLSGLKKNGEMISYGSDSTMSLTENGREYADPNDESLVVDNGALLEKARADAPGTKGKEVFDILSDGKKHSRASIAAKLNWDSNADKNKMSVLFSNMKKNGVLEYCENDAGEKAVMLPDNLFPFGRDGDK